MVALHTRAYELQARAFIENPSADELRSFTAQMTNAKETACGNLDVFTRVDARSAGSTYIVGDDAETYRGHQVMRRAEYEKMAAIQDQYMAREDMLVIDGYISNEPEVQTAARLII